LGVPTSLGSPQICGAHETNPQNGTMNPRLFTFVGGNAGAWTVIKNQAVAGEPLAEVKRLAILNTPVPILRDGAQWMLRGVTSNERYATRAEKDRLVAKQVAIGRPEATHGALIPIRKNASWWALTQDERRAIFEERSRHVQTGLKYLPAVARRLHHCRDLGWSEPFDFLTLFDYAPADASAFEDMVAELRATEEWTFVDREIDIRLVRGEG
jgi:Chlorite dismutase